MREICAKHGVPYVQESVFRRVRKLVDVMVGKTSMLRGSTRAGRGAGVMAAQATAESGAAE